MKYLLISLVAAGLMGGVATADCNTEHTAQLNCEDEGKTYVEGEAFPCQDNNPNHAGV